MCKVPSHVARQRSTSRKRVRSNGGSGAVGARGEPGAGAGGEQEAEANPVQAKLFVQDVINILKSSLQYKTNLQPILWCLSDKSGWNHNSKV